MNTNNNTKTPIVWMIQDIERTLTYNRRLADDIVLMDMVEGGTFTFDDYIEQIEEEIRQGVFGPTVVEHLETAIREKDVERCLIVAEDDDRYAPLFYKIRPHVIPDVIGLSKEELIPYFEKITDTLHPNAEIIPVRLQFAPTLGDLITNKEASS